MAFTPPGHTRERVYRYVRDRLLAGHPPTVRDVQEAMGFSAVQSAVEHLNKLVEQGRLVKAPGKARAFRLPARLHPRGTVLVPVFSRLPRSIAARAADDHDP